MLLNSRVIALIVVCFAALLILTSCQLGYSTPETTEEAVSVPEVIGETVVVIEPVGVAQPTVEQQTIEQTPTEKKQPPATLSIVEPTANPPTEESVPKILLIDRMADWDNLTYTRLIEIAASKGVKVDIFDGHQFIIDDSYNGIIVFGGGDYKNPGYGGISPDRLRDLCNFAGGGGRFVFFALPRLAIINDSLRWACGPTVASEYITPPGKDVISVPGGVLSEMWSGLEIGSKTAYDEVSLQTYFESPLEPYTSMSNLDGVQRKTSVSGGFNSGGEYLFISNFATGDGDIQYRNNGNFLHDGNIDGWDNQKAVEILIDWLVGND